MPSKRGVCIIDKLLTDEQCDTHLSMQLIGLDSQTLGANGKQADAPLSNLFMHKLAVHLVQGRGGIGGGGGGGGGIYSAPTR